MMISDRVFFIIGSQRSGTTLMRLVLECHSQIHCRDEKRSYHFLSDPSGQRSFDTHRLGLKVPQLTEQLSDCYLKDDQAIRTSSPGVPNPYNAHRIVFMIREALDTVSSMLALDGWLEEYGGSVLERKMNDDLDFRQKYAEEIEELHRSQSRKASQAALIWLYKVDALFTYISKGYPVLPVWYESLVGSPRIELAAVCSFLDVPWEATLMQHDALPHGELMPGGRAIGNTDPGRAIDDTAVGRWQHDLSTRDVDAVARLTDRMQTKLRLLGNSCRA
jgi:hypothetical protein